MSEEDYPEKPSGFLLGKEFIIVLVVVFSGLSFTLGYFVGKNSLDTATMSPQQTAEGIAQLDRQEPMPALPVQPTETARDGASLQPVQGTSVEAAPVVAIPDKHDREDAVTVPQERQRTAVPPKNTKTVAENAGTEKTASETAAGNRADEKTKLYTVQIGAFKSAAEAKQLKTTFEKKGYKPFISLVKDSKGRNIHKVKTGEFTDKKDAEVLALKLKKTEGLHTYVTIRSE